MDKLDIPGKQDGSTIEKADLVWDMYKYRHDLCWRLLFRTILAVVAVSVAPYSNIELSKALGCWLVVLPLLGLTVNVLPIRRMPTEVELWKEIKEGHFKLQSDLKLPETEEKKNARPFKEDLMNYLYLLVLLGLCNILAIILVWVPALAEMKK